jgi:hypothetical protein
MMPSDQYFYAPDPYCENDKEAFKVLHLIVAEFESDPMSVQCFDLRIVQRAKDCIAKQKQWERAGKLPPLLTEGAR